MQFSLRGNLPFITITLGYQQQTAVIANVLVDTGSASTILATEAVARVQIVPMPMDYGFQINGILGMDFLTQSGALIDLQSMRLTFAGQSP